MKQEIHSNWYGAAYYPEHWPEERWAVDARMMRAAGLNLVRLGEFAWCRMEPAEDKFAFDWLKNNIDILAKEGLSVLLGTPTAGPPAWLVNAKSAEQDCRMLYEDGTRWEFGGLPDVQRPQLRQGKEREHC
jgi:beta-galactosidase